MAKVFISGSSSGLGASLAKRFVEAGHAVAGLARNQQRLQEQHDQLGDLYHPIIGDLAQTDQLGEFVAAVNSALDGCPDIIIHNAGIFQLGAFSALSASVMEKMWRVNTLAPMIMTQAWLPTMQARKSGRIICIASVAGIHGLAGQASYCASKHGMVGFADALGNELRGSGVSVHTICPGGINTPLWKSGEVSYPGDVEQTMSVDEISNLVVFITQQPHGTLYRRVICFPESEWH